ncbi:histidinol-phosphate transaminase [Actinomyces sp. MRS3W]|uniref:histidinol-phosphate transaminase n=1 Tax=Actinomyces sp. MRS3W TaxID=2800796 RepID=UPI0028FD2D73|nr:histidinol-phosphate transaminase [Actinomyces sp. MRS3W]MDU0347361.1 histidinol-phosphate transaminase [Actinomyces sp. MRS3W]
MTPVHIRSAVQTLPAYVPGARSTGDGIAKLSSNELPYPAQDSVIAALTGAATGVNRYPEMTGDTLVEAIARRHSVAPEQVVVGNGSVALVQHVLDTVCDEGDDVVLPWRSFEAYPICIAVAGARAIKVPVTADGRHDVPAMLAAITPRTRVVIACTPNNPTGPALTAAELAELVEGVPERVLVLVDEAYLDFVTDDAVGDALSLLADHPNLLVSRTFSKAHALAGMRVGYLVGEPGIISAIRSVATPFGVNLPAQAAAVAALEPAALAETARRAAAVAAERDRVLDALREQGWQLPDAQGNFYWLQVGDQTTALAAHLRDAGILARPFTGEGVRISVGTPAENDRVLAAVAAWRALHA